MPTKNHASALEFKRLSKTVNDPLAFSDVQMFGSIIESARRLLARPGFFDEYFYASQVKLPPGGDYFVHFFISGYKEGLRPNCIFDSLWYLNTNADVVNSNINPLLHFVLYGEEEGRNPSTMFNTIWYKSRYNIANESAMLHYLKHRFGRYSPIPEFDSEFYISTYPDIEKTGVDPFEHYLSRGCEEGRRPNSIFEASWYTEKYPDVAISGLNPLLHYATIGEKEARDPSQVFDTSWYMSRYELAPGTPVLRHYIDNRFRNSPIPEFDIDFYLQTYRDVAETGADPFEHYLAWGYKEGRRPSAEFDPNSYAQQFLANEADTNPILHFRRNKHDPLFMSIYNHSRPDVKIAASNAHSYGFNREFDEKWPLQRDDNVIATREEIIALPLVQDIPELYENGAAHSLDEIGASLSPAPSAEPDFIIEDSAPEGLPQSSDEIAAPQLADEITTGEVRQRLIHNDGKIVLAANVDRVIGDHQFLVIAGWSIGCGVCRVFNESGDLVAPATKVVWFSRDDVASAYEQDPQRVRGFLMIWNSRPCRNVKLSFDSESQGTVDLRLASPDVLDANTFETVVTEHATRLGAMLANLCDIPAVVRPVTAQLSGSRGASAYVRGHLEHAKGVPDVGGFVAGWLVAEPRVRGLLIDQHGHAVNLQHATRWHRDDIVQATSDDFGGYASNGGMWQSWPHPFTLGDELKLIAIVGDEAVQVSSVRWALAPVEPVSFSRWAFTFVTPRDGFAERLTRHDGPIIARLLDRAAASRSSGAPKISVFGVQNENPLCSIIIPLYRRFDFMLNQFLEFERDDTIRFKTELIYVVDDPLLVGPVEGEAARLHKTHGVPFKTVWAGQNRGFAGANNVGVAVSSAPRILLMNSDVIPTKSGWLDAMLSALDANPKLGVLGGRLHFPSGAIQHDGMSFKWEPDWGAYLNKHPGAGLNLPITSRVPVERVAVTAALALLNREVYDAVGGLDETFLIGDFEDSDLCLKVRQLGLGVACLQSVEGLIHLERQSFSAIGAPSYRELVARFNAWKHQTRWGEYIRSLLQDSLAG